MRTVSTSSYDTSPTKLCCFLLLGIVTASCSSIYRTTMVSLVDTLDQAETRIEDARYPSFVDSPRLSGPIDIDGNTYPSLTPPFPSRLSFTLETPPNAFLEFSTALVMPRRVTRASVDYAVEVEAEGDRTVAYTESYSLVHSNQWHDHEVDLTRWGGKTITISLSIRPTSLLDQVPWADRIQTVWGNPVVVSSRAKHIVSRVRSITAPLEQWLQDNAGAVGMTPGERSDLLRLALNLLLGGALSIFIRELYKRFGTTPSNRESFANMFPLFTLTTIMVIFVVQTSVALSLGLIGALSIVRFRSAIKSAEELSYLLFCVAVGLALAANQLLLGLAAIVVITAFILARPAIAFKTNRLNLLLIVSGDTARFFDEDDTESVFKVVDGMTTDQTIQRFDHFGDRAELRALVILESDEAAMRLASKLQSQPYRLQVSFENADDIF